MKLFILEDELLQQERLEKFIVNYLIEKDYPVERVIACNKIQHFLESLENMSQNNIYFLDINIKGSRDAGLKVAQAIRKVDPIGQINFVTTHSEFAPLTYDYKVKAYDFINKSLPKAAFEARVSDNIEAFFESQYDTVSKKDVFAYKSRSGYLVNALYADIYFFESGSSSHQILLNMKNEVITFYGSLADIEAKSDDLIRIHRNTVVNQNKVKLYRKKSKQVVLEDDTVFSVSRMGCSLLNTLGKW
ncbi:LytTR family DNA-binding domain-containing protein [Pseudolactococcus yaeyamensis]